MAGRFYVVRMDILFKKRNRIRAVRRIDLENRFAPAMFFISVPILSGSKGGRAVPIPGSDSHQIRPPYPQPQAIPRRIRIQRSALKLLL